MKKILCRILLLVVFCFTIKVNALTPDENMLKKIPDTIKLDIKESEVFDKGYSILYSKEEEIKSNLEKQGYDFNGYYLSVAFKNPIDEENYSGYNDIHTAIIKIIQTNHEGASFVKEVKINYSNSSDYNDKDATYVKNKIAPIWFHRYHSKELGSDEEIPEDIESITSLVNDESITIKTEQHACGAGYLDAGLICNTSIYFLKNDVLYGIKIGGYKKYYSITIPNETKENTQSYIDYALPKVQKFLEDENITLKGKILADRNNETEDTVKTEYDYYYAVQKDGTIKEISAKEDSGVAKVEFTNAHFSLFFDVIDENEGYSYGQIILRKANTFVVNDTITVNSKLKDGTTITAEPIKDDILTGMKKHLNNLEMTDVLSSYELKLNGATDGNITITFALGTKYNDKRVYILHKKKDGSYENFNEIVKEGSVTITVSELSPFVIALSNIAPGDLNGDGKLTLTDVLMTLKSYFNGNNIEKAPAADLNGDGKITLTDVLMLLKLYFATA